MAKKVCKPVKSLLQQQVDELSTMRAAVDATVADRAKLQEEFNKISQEFRQVRTRLESARRALDDTDGLLKVQREKLLREATAAHNHIEVGIAPDREALMKGGDSLGNMVF